MNIACYKEYEKKVYPLLRERLEYSYVCNEESMDVFIFISVLKYREYSPTFVNMSNPCAK